jgi:polar amino acid transport system substrate-binding protein
MPPRCRSSWRIASLALAAVTLMPAAGRTQAPAVTPDMQLRARLPADIQTRGVLNVGMAVGYAPFEYFSENGSAITGLDADLARAVGEVLGIRVSLMNIAYDSLGPSLKTHRIDLIWSGEGDTHLKEQNFDYVDYLDNKLAILVRKGNPRNIHSLSDLCGHTVATGKTSMAFIAYIEKTSVECQHLSKSPLHMLQFGSANDVDLAVRSGRADAAFNAYPQAVFVSSLPAAGTEIAAPPAPLTPIGAGVLRSSALATVLRDALLQVVASGRYEQILKQHHVWECCRLPSIAINAATL